MTKPYLSKRFLKVVMKYMSTNGYIGRPLSIFRTINSTSHIGRTIMVIDGTRASANKGSLFIDSLVAYLIYDAQKWSLFVSGKSNMPMLAR